ncbi:MAG: hypothetical protein HYW89_03035 [Candidatus Sungiibacteriota bacterium]|uniref:Uncharacterized protein n=1 Tax=Candidatus Sungiibacteriota bacterium TaxID=2750080 RepID=A0A7T5URT7_9BACT|nr:MAG: hypothetical protein HYW89_03035 [Candidatus Sungbacteria bacterium]
MPKKSKRSKEKQTICVVCKLPIRKGTLCIVVHSCTKNGRSRKRCRCKKLAHIRHGGLEAVVDNREAIGMGD